MDRKRKRTECSWMTTCCIHVTLCSSGEIRNKFSSSARGERLSKAKLIRQAIFCAGKTLLGANKSALWDWGPRQSGSLNHNRSIRRYRDKTSENGLE